MPWLLIIVLALATSLTGLAAGKADDGKALPGIWLPVHAELGGQPIPEVVLKMITLKITPGNYAVSVTGMPTPDLGTWALDPAAKRKGITITGRQGPNAGMTLPILYDIKGGTLRVCCDLAGGKRPAEFKTRSGTQLLLVTCQRQQPPAKRQ